MSDPPDDAFMAPIIHPGCSLHDDPQGSLCGAVTYRTRLPCKYQAKVFKDGYLPVCRKHQDFHFHNQREQLRAGRCQALEACGYTCNRLADYYEPYHFCFKHENGTNTIPCHLLRLPTELRLMIFRYLFPKVVPSEYRHAVKVAILKTNRQIHREASSVLYGESYFQATILPSSIWLQGKLWDHFPNVQNDSDTYSIENTLHCNSLHLIRNLVVELVVGHLSVGGKGIDYRGAVTSNGITREDYELYLLRDTVRKLVEYFYSSSLPTGGQIRLKWLKVVTSVDRTFFNWTADEGIAAQFLVLEPLQQLHALNRTLAHPKNDTEVFTATMQKWPAYRHLRRQWLSASSEVHASTALGMSEPSFAICNGLRELGTFTQLLHAYNSVAQPWISGMFHDMHRPLHLARVAYENQDISAMRNIQDAVLMRWIEGHRQHQLTNRALTDSLNNMYEYNFRGDHNGQHLPSLREVAPDVFANEDPTGSIEESESHLWKELSAKDDAPKCGDPAVDIRLRGVWMRIRKGGQQWFRLRTPAVVRQMRKDQAPDMMEL